jgi:hypothetical protein
MQDGLTQFDLGLEPKIRAQYAMSKVLAWALTDQYTFAECEPRLHYRPRAELDDPAGDSPYQGLPSGAVETAGQALIVRTANGAARVMRFGEFDETFSDQRNPVHVKCAPVASLLYDFHPRSHPVLWRVLITQAHLCASFVAARDDRPPETVEPWNAIPIEHRTDYDWRQGTDDIDDPTVLAEPFEVAKAYLQSRLHII